ncbi:MAG TPA: YraN family protein [Gaiellaceae bacterium]|nr:YraN family protein [Gaiellaceae bacterium]
MRPAPPLVPGALLRRLNRDARTRRGAAEEARVARHYLARGYRVVGRNVWAAGNEIDLIVRRGRSLVFCEVKAKRGDRFGDPLAMVDEEKVRRLVRAAEAWLARHPDALDLDARFEVAAVRGKRVQRVPLHL